MITIESINKKLGFDIREYEYELRSDTEYDAPMEPLFDSLTDEEVFFIIDYRLGLEKDKSSKHTN
ncbi:MAG: hypothetical protein Q4B23_06765 [Helcococcus sp.]|nr:hypothetical protein [Helcococcus sp.]